jgi:hypothetical protein
LRPHCQELRTRRHRNHIQETHGKLDIPDGLAWRELGWEGGGKVEDRRWDNLGTVGELGTVLGDEGELVHGFLESRRHEGLVDYGIAVLQRDHGRSI